MSAHIEAAPGSVVPVLSKLTYISRLISAGNSCPRGARLKSVPIITSEAIRHVSIATILTKLHVLSRTWGEIFSREPFNSLLQIAFCLGSPGPKTEQNFTRTGNTAGIGVPDIVRCEQLLPGYVQSGRRQVSFIDAFMGLTFAVGALSFAHGMVCLPGFWREQRKFILTDTARDRGEGSRAFRPSPELEPESQDLDNHPGAISYFRPADDYNQHGARGLEE